MNRFGGIRDRLRNHGRARTHEVVQPPARVDPRALLLRGVSNHGVAIRLGARQPATRPRLARARKKVRR